MPSCRLAPKVLLVLVLGVVGCAPVGLPPPTGSQWAFYTDTDLVLGPRAVIYMDSQIACEMERRRRVGADTAPCVAVTITPGPGYYAIELPANIDPAFERRIRTHILFEMPDDAARERIWRVQIHSRKTPLADDVDFADLAARYPRSGGDIKNAVLKAAQIATTEPGPDASKRIHQRHFVQGMEEVIAAEGIMGQSLFDPGASPVSPGGVLEQMAEGQEQLRAELAIVAERLEALDDRQAGLSKAQADVLERLRTPAARVPLYLAVAALLAAAAALVVSLVR